MSKTETAEAATNGAAAAKVADLGLLEEDDEFEEFPAEGNILGGIGATLECYYIKSSKFYYNDKEDLFCDH